MSHLKRLIHEIHRRSVWQVIGIYLLGGWIALQVVETLVDSLGLPEWFPAFAVMLLIVGFPIVVATAFVQEGVGGGSPAPASGAAAGEDAPDRSPAPSPPTEPASNLAAGTGSLDRPSTRPPKLYRLLTWRNAIGGGVLAFALWGVVAAAWMGVNAWADRQLGPVGEGGEAPAARADGGNHLKSIAVLPFDNLSADAENAFFADGIHEDVLTQLSRIGDLTVISRTSVMAYRDASTPLAQIARELNVGSILEGSVRRSGDNVRITAQLIDAETDRHLWADNFDRALTAANVFAIQTEIAQRIADALAATLSPEEESRIARLPTENLEAYEATLRGRESYRFYTTGGNDEAIRLFRLAIESDPEYAEPWAGLADAFGQRVLRYGYGREWADSAQAAADRALELDPELATAYKAAALARVVVGDFEGSIDLNLRAIELDPNYADPMMNTGVGYGALGRLAESLRFTRRGFRLQPNVAFARSNLAFAHATLGDFATARAMIGEALAIDPGDLDAKTTLLSIAWLEGDTADVLRVGEELEATATDIPFALAYVADAYLYAGQYERALDLTRHSLTISPDQGIVGLRHIGVMQGFAQQRLGESSAAHAILQAQLVARQASWDSAPGSGNTAYQIATIHAAMGDSDEALGWLERHGDLALNWAYFLLHDPMWDDLRGDARFEGILTGMLSKVEEMRLEIEREGLEAVDR